MAWDFSTEPEFERELAWMRDFVREELWPLEAVVGELDQAALDGIYAPLQGQVKARGLWAAHLPPELGGQGFGQVKLGLMHEILGTTPWAPNAFGCQAPDSGNSEILALAGTQQQKERYLHPLLAGDLRSAFSMTEPGAGADPTLLRTRAVRDGDGWTISGHKWFSSNASVADFLIVMAVTDPDARPHQRASMFLVDAGTPGVEILRDVPTMEHPQEAFGSAGTRRSSFATSAFPRTPSSAGRGRGSSSPSTASARGGSTTACAGWARRGERSTCSASARPTATPTARRWGRRESCRPGSPTRPPSCTPPGS